VVPWQVAGEFLACMRRWQDAGRIKQSDTKAYLTHFLAPLPIILPTTNSLGLSLHLSNRFSLSHWDSMLLAACIEAGVDVLYSEDLTSAASYDSVRVINPFAST